LVLIFATYLLTIVGTFMTRSGVFNSVHSFTQSDIGPVFLGFIAAIGVFSIGLMAFRLHLLEGDAEDAKPGLPLLSREMTLILQNFLFALFTFVVLLGTLYPLIMEAWDGRRLSVGEPYFDRLSLPIGVLIVFLLGVGPALPWGEAKSLKRLVYPTVGGLALAGIFAAFGFTKPGTVVAIAVSGFAAVANLAEWLEAGRARQRAKGEALPLATWNALTRMRRRVGGHIAHLGVVVCVIAIALSKGYKTETDLVLKPGETAVFAGYTLRFQGTETHREAHRDRQVAYIAVSREGADDLLLEPALNTYRRMREPIGTPAVSSGLRGDLYLSLMQVAPKGEWVAARVMYMPGVPWIWVSVFAMAAGGLISAWPSRATQPAAAKATAPRGAEPAA
jgi:cytochrome c-type biogenesis protein CcmF